MKKKLAINNAKWMIGCKIIQSLLQFVVGLLSARYLGPSNYGLIHYAASIVAFAVPVMQLGMTETLVQDYVSGKYEDGQVLGTGLVMNLVSSAACVIGVVCFATVANYGEPMTIAVCALYSISLCFQALDMTKYWFQAKLLSKYASLAAVAAYILVSVYKLYLLVFSKSVYWFALSHAVEFGASGIFMLVAYVFCKPSGMSFSIAVAKDLFSRSKYYIVANLMVTTFQNVGPVLLKQTVGDAENGFYSAAVTCVAITGFVYAAVVDSARPIVLDSKKNSETAYQKNVTRLYCGIIYLSLLQSISYILLAKPMIYILYGRAYVPAVAVLRVLSLQTAFSNVGTIRNIWILGEEKYSILWKINLSGALVNVVLNTIMIPLWGACGAAVASVGTQFFTNVVMGFILKPIRENNRLMLKGFNPKLLIELYGLLRQK